MKSKIKTTSIKRQTHKHIHNFQVIEKEGKQVCNCIAKNEQFHKCQNASAFIQINLLWACVCGEIKETIGKLNKN